MRDKELYARRKSLRLKNHDYSNAGAYFVTVCTHRRAPMLGHIEDSAMVLSPAGQIVWDIWQKLPEHYSYLALGPFVVMPNHFHGIVHVTGSVGAIHESPLPAPAAQRSSDKSRRSMSLPLIIGRLKMVSAKYINGMRNAGGQPVWQRSYHEHVIRSDESYAAIAEYIETNPQRWADDVYNSQSAVRRGDS